MEITVSSRETIKPSSPTPPHLKHWKLSLFDQSMPQSIYARVLFFYSAQGDTNRFQNTNMSDLLKSSLSEVLTDFYPLAGRYDSSNSVECTDDGVEYIEARVKAPLTLDQLLVTCTNSDELDPLYPYDAHSYGTGFRGLSAVQVTVFEACGGMAIGVSICHALSDGSSLALFVNSWSDIARRGGAWTPAKTVTAPFNFATLFSPRNVSVITPLIDFDTQVPKKLITNRFAFPKRKIESLKEKFAYQHPTRVEMVSALIFKCFLNMSTSTSSKPVLLGTAMNLRTRMSPPLPARYLGNLVLPLLIKQTHPEASMNDLGMLLRKLTKEIDGDYVKKLQANNALLLREKLMLDGKLSTSTSVRLFALSSLCKLPFHKADVGWGAPISVIPRVPNCQDAVMLVDAINGDGIEAWVTLNEDDMARFEFELLDFTGPDSRISKL